MQKEKLEYKLLNANSVSCKMPPEDCWHFEVKKYIVPHFVHTFFGTIAPMVFGSTQDANISAKIHP